MPPIKSITLLHVSDMQFGRNHRFGNLGLGDADAPLDTLFQRLSSDLSSLEKLGIMPEVLVVSGDLAEWAKKQEFEDAFSFIAKLADRLRLARRRVVIIPGNHDVNRQLCASYFLECEGEDRKPMPPFAAKWKHFQALVSAFYGDDPDLQFTGEQPYMYWEVPELNLAIAALNSTMGESHLPESHFGSGGERQYQWFGERLSGAKSRGLFRLGVIHHNLQRGATGDDENLRDFDDLQRHLGDVLNLILHGHTHSSKIGWLTPSLPILSTGSAALNPGVLPSDIPNQYQAIRIYGNRIERWTRRYDGVQKRWIGDTRCSDAGDQWHVIHDVLFDSVEAVFSTEQRIEELSSGNQTRRLKQSGRSSQLTSPKASAKSTGKTMLDAFDVLVTPRPVVNYSMIQNGRGMFENFLIRKLVPGRIRGVLIEVSLHVGSEEFPYRTMFDIDHAVTELSSRVRVPLPATLVQGIDEPVVATLYVSISVEGTEIHCDTRSLLVVPIDEWRDDEQDRMWLPSFVQPRDVAVSRIFDGALPILTVLSDDPNIGFVGYQAIDETASDPFVGVDLQVRAIWSVLAFDTGLSYINPPPTYTQESQRLRTPSEVLDGRRGTSIDLALLLASCLEYVEIYPAIILLRAHAFLAYWRSDAAWSDFLDRVAAEDSASKTSSDDIAPWCFGAKHRNTILKEVKEGRLVPLETVELSQRGRFQSALEEGLQNLKGKEGFDVMIDVARARENGVTPLPTRRGGQVRDVSA